MVGRFVLVSVFMASCGLPSASSDGDAPASSGAPMTTGTATTGTPTSSATTSGDGSTTSSTGAAVTSSTGTTTTTPPGGWTGEWQPIADLGSEDSDGFIARTDLGDGMCDLWLNNCPEGQKCTPGGGYGGGSCQPLARNPGGLGDACVPESCDIGLYCQLGQCHLLCDRDNLDMPCPVGSVCPFAAFQWPPLCHDNCDPTAPVCPAGEICEYGVPPGFFCWPSDHDTPIFGDCPQWSACGHGRHCTARDRAVECADNVGGCCLPYCDITAANTCPGSGQECVAFFSNPPAELEHVGLCQLPD